MGIFNLIPVSTSNLIPGIGERIEKLDMAIFSGSGTYWRYPACIIRHIKVDRSGTRLWFKMKNISLDDPGGEAPAFLFCYNKQFDFYVTVEGDARVSGLAGDLRAPTGWQDPIFANQTTYLIRMDIRHASIFSRGTSLATTAAPVTSAPHRIANLFAGRSFLPRPNFFRFTQPF